MKCDVKIYCEAQLTAQELDSVQYQITGYELHCNEGVLGSTGRSHYGLAMYARSHIMVDSCLVPDMTESDNESVECDLMKISVNPHSQMNIVCLYRRPSTVIEQLRTVVKKLLSYIQINRVSAGSGIKEWDIIIGDFNLDLSEDKNKKVMSNIFHGYRQLVLQSATDYRSWLDHVYTNIHEDMIKTFVSEVYYSDHKAIICYINKDHGMIE